MEYLGDGEYEEHIVSPFDDFLHDSFSILSIPLNFDE